MVFSSLIGQDLPHFPDVMKRSEELEGAMGAIAFAVLEMFRRGGMSESDVQALHEKMKTHFMVPTNDECNAICKMVELRLQGEKQVTDGLWYSKGLDQ